MRAPHINGQTKWYLTWTLAVRAAASDPAKEFTWSLSARPLAAREVGDLGDVPPHLAEFVGEGLSAFAEGWIVGREEAAVSGQLQRRPEHLGRDGLLAGQPTLERPLAPHAQPLRQELPLLHPLH